MGISCVSNVATKCLWRRGAVLNTAYRGPKWSSVKLIAVPKEEEFDGMLIPHQHHGLLFENSKTDEYEIVHFTVNSRGKGVVRHASLADFVGESSVEMVKEVSRSEEHAAFGPTEAYRRACNMRPQPFDFWRNNSEHFATEVLYGCKASSEADLLEELFLPSAFIGR